MRVGVYAPDCSPSVGGGFTFMRQVLSSLGKAAPASQHSFVVFTHSASVDLGPHPLPWQRLPPMERVRGWSYRARRLLKRRLSRFLNPLEPPLDYYQVDYYALATRFLREHGIEVMFHPGPVCLSLEIPYILTVWDLEHRHQPFFPEVSGNGEWVTRERQYQASLQRATWVITGTQVGRDQIERYYQTPRERIRILPHPTPDFALHPETLVQAGRPGDEQLLRENNIGEGFLLYPAQFWSHKNHVGLLRAVQVLRDRHGMKFPVVLVGSDQGNLSFVKHEADRLQLGDQVRFLGFVPRDLLVALYRHAFALVYPTFFGPENLPPLEAFALGCPVIASAVPGSEEQLGDAALRVDPKDESAIAEAIRTLHSDPQLRKTLIERGRQRARRFTGDDFVAGVIEMLDSFSPLRRCWQL